MMTKKEVNELVNLFHIFQEKCDRITELLKPMDKVWERVYEYEPYEDEVICVGDDKDEHYCASFPTHLLYSTDEEIVKWRDEEIKRKKEERERLRQARNFLENMEERKAIEKLFHKYGNIDIGELYQKHVLS